MLRKHRCSILRILNEYTHYEGWVRLERGKREVFNSIPSFTSQRNVCTTQSRVSDAFLFFVFWSLWTQRCQEPHYCQKTALAPWFLYSAQSFVNSLIFLTDYAICLLLVPWAIQKPQGLDPKRCLTGFCLHKLSVGQFNLKRWCQKNPQQIAERIGVTTWEQVMLRPCLIRINTKGLKRATSNK